MKKMKRLIATIVMVVICLVQQGCYMCAARDGKYFASTQEIWKSRHSEWFFLPSTIGECMIITGALIPVVGWVTLVPVGLATTVAEHWVVAPVYDTVLLPRDYLNNRRLRRIDEEKYQDMRYRLEFNLDATLADPKYWENREYDKLRYLNRWLSAECDRKNLSASQVSAILSVLISWVKGSPDIDWSTILEIDGIVKTVYEKSCEREALDMLVKGLVEIKTAAPKCMFRVIPEEISREIEYESAENGRVKFNDEQLMALRDAGIMSREIASVLTMRQEKREKGGGGPYGGKNNLTEKRK